MNAIHPSIYLHTIIKVIELLGCHGVPDVFSYLLVQRQRILMQRQALALKRSETSVSMK